MDMHPEGIFEPKVSNAGRELVRIIVKLGSEVLYKVVIQVQMV